MSLYYLLDFHIVSSSLFILQLPPSAQRIPRSERTAIYSGQCEAKNSRISGCEWEFVHLTSACCDTAGISRRSGELVDLVVH